MTISRRTLLKSASLLALPFPIAAEAKSLPAALSPTTSGGRAVIGTMIEAGMFKNLALSLISLQSAPGYAYPAILDGNGYPTSTPTYNIFGVVHMPSTISTGDQMVLKWLGTGSVQLARGAPGFTVSAGTNFVSGSASYNLTVAGTNPRVVFSFNSSVPSSITFNFLAGGQFRSMSGLVLCRLQDEPSIDSATTPEQMFDDNYVATYRAFAPGIVRSMGWTNPNSGNVSQMRYIPPWRTSMNISSQRWAPGAWAGSTTGTNAYACQAQPDATASYVHGEMIQVQFSSANTSTSVTLNSGGRGIVPVLRATGSSAGRPPAVGAISAGVLATLTYDAVLGAFLWQPSGQTPCIPYELQIAFANRIGAHYWCNFSASMDDRSVSAITALVRDRLNPNLTAYFEYGNEIWNNTFPATDFARLKGAALGFPTDNDRQLHGWYGLRYCQVMSLVTSAWSSRSTSQLKRVMAFQAFGPTAGTTRYRFLGADLTGSSYPQYKARQYLDYNVAPNRPIDMCDVLSYATYYSGAQCTNFDANYVSLGATKISDLLAAADNYASGVPTKMNSAIAFIEADVRAGTVHGSTSVGSQTLAGLNLTYNGTGIYPAWETIAAQFAKSVECYEGGFEASFPSVAACTTMGIATSYGGPSGRIAALLNAFKLSDNFASVVSDQIIQFRSQRHSTRPAWLLIPGVNQWALSSGDCFAPKYKSWPALVAYNLQQAS